MRQLQAKLGRGRRSQRYPLGSPSRSGPTPKLAKCAFNKSHSAATLSLMRGRLKAQLPELHGRRAHRLHRQHRPPHPLYRQLLQDGAGAAARHQRLRAGFTPVEGGIRFGLVGVRGVGKSVADEIIAEREANGPFVAARFREPARREMLQPQDARALIKGQRLRLHRLHRKQLILRGERRCSRRSQASEDRDTGRYPCSTCSPTTLTPASRRTCPLPDGMGMGQRTKLAYEKGDHEDLCERVPAGPPMRARCAVCPYDMGTLSEQTRRSKNSVFVGMISNVATEAHEARHEDGHVHAGGHQLHQIHLPQV